MTEHQKAFNVTSKTAAKLPNEFAYSVNFGAVTETAFKTFFYLIARYQAGPRIARRVRFKWRDLFAYLSQDEQRAMEGNDYRQFNTAVRQLAAAHLEFYEGLKLTRLNLIQDIVHDAARGYVSVSLTKHFDHMLALIGTANFTLVNLRQLARLPDIRSMRMLVWCYEFLHIDLPVFRTIPLDHLRKALDMKAASYDDWHQMDTKLKQYQKQINANTDLRLQLVPVKEGRKVIAVRFDVRRTKRIEEAM